MKLGVLFSGGKDSTYSAWLAKKNGNELTCLISVFSSNPDSFMFHTPNIKLVEKQAEVMRIPLVKWKTKGVKEFELVDLEHAIKEAKEKFGIDGLVTGALYSNYQASRIKKICDSLKLACINPIWHKDEIEYLKELVKNNFKIIITAVAAYPLGKEWVGKIIDREFVERAKILEEEYKIHPAGEGGEFETFVFGCPLFKRELKVLREKSRIYGSGNSWKMEIEVE